jgi:hypothetical protein
VALRWSASRICLQERLEGDLPLVLELLLPLRRHLPGEVLAL